MAALLVLSAASALGVGARLRAEPVEVVLSNGAEVRAELLQRTDERLVLDLGFMVLTIPANQAATVSSGDAAGSGLLSTPAASADEATTSTALALAAAAAASGGGETRLGRAKRGDLVERLEEAIVIVSNPGGMGAGFVVDPSGLVVTNHHVVRGERYNDITYYRKVESGKVEKKVFRRVEVQAYSTLLDCALLKIPAEDLEGIDLPYLGLAASDSLRPSMRVTAVGNPAVGATILDHTISQGILSSTNRNFNDILYLQTTAAVNPGNSGGPLLNDAGEVVGLVTFRAFFQEGLGFALPVWYLRLFLDNVKAYAPTQDTKNTGYRYHDPMSPE
ncbi:trypsin-like peptidase domain-containing protein [Candidatus Sumerlaeota bacterium]|nr:trypsin-like peptidase domain-containing protein [Candidatus Sumerlaeota bacterium]